MVITYFLFLIFDFSLFFIFHLSFNSDSLIAPDSLYRSSPTALSEK